MSGIDKYTKSLLHFNDLPTLDATGREWTKSGSPALNSSIKKIGNNSLYLNGSSYLTTPVNDDLNFSTGDFTIDWWEYRTVDTYGHAILSIATSPTDNTNNAFSVGWTNFNATVCAYISSTGSSWDILGNFSMGTAIINTWTHYALVRSGSTFKSYQNGINISTATSSSNFVMPGNLYIGARGNINFTGNIDEFRISKGIARWTANFTPQTTPYEVDQYTKVLMHMEPQTYKDEVGKIWTPSGIPQTTVTQSKFGGKSILFNGVNQCLATPAITDFDFGANSFTIDWWEYRTNISNAGNGVFSNASKLGLHVGGIESGNVTAYASSNGSSWDIINGLSLGTPDLNVWSHRAIVRNGNTFYGFKNGTLISTITVASALVIYFSGGTTTVGCYQDNNGINQYWFNGYIDEFRISKGIARWTTAFTPPVLPYSKIRFLAKTDDGHYHAYLNSVWTDLGTVSNNVDLKTLFLSNEVLDPVDLVSLNLLSPSNKIKECCYQENINEALLANKNIAIPKAQFVQELNDIDLKGISYLDWIKVNNGDTSFEVGGGKLRMVVSRDSGKTWWSYILDSTTNTYSWQQVMDTTNIADGTFDTINIKRFIPSDSAMNRIITNGMTVDTFNNQVPWNAWTLDQGYKTVRVGYALSIDASTNVALSDTLSYQYDGVGDWMIATANIHYEVRTKNNSHTIKWLDKIGGTRVKINY